MDLTPVKSSNIKAVGYDHRTNALTIEFRSGGIHTYQDVPPEKHAAFMASDSLGKYFHKHIRHHESVQWKEQR